MFLNEEKAQFRIPFGRREVKGGETHARLGIDEGLMFEKDAANFLIMKINTQAIKNVTCHNSYEDEFQHPPQIRT